jgi:hypothetical protein
MCRGVSKEGGKSGMFPITYVEPISPDQQMPALAASVPTES